MGTAAVFRRAGSLTLHADRVRGLGGGLHDALEENLVLPVVAKVIRVPEGNFLAVLGNELTYADLL